MDTNHIVFFITCIGITITVCSSILPLAILGTWLMLRSIKNTVLTVIDSTLEYYHERRFRD